MKLRICLIIMALAIGFSPVATAQQKTSNEKAATTAADVNPIVEKFCEAFDEYIYVLSERIYPLDYDKYQNRIIAKQARLDKSVVLTAADKEALKDTYWDLTYASMVYGLMMEGTTIEDLDYKKKKQFDEMMKRAKTNMFKAIDGSRTLGDVERNMK